MTEATQGQLARPPAVAAPPPCQGDRQRWLDREHRTYALASCLRCPVRRRCAQEALRTRASWGMWAGIWIDRRHLSDSTRYLLAIAADDATAAPQTTFQTTTPPTASDAPREPLPPMLPVAGVEAPSVSAAVLARSSGHCEVLADRCRFSADTHVSRVTGGSGHEATSAATVYSACTPCAQRLANAPIEAHRLGYLVDAATQAAAAPVYWRGVRWVFLGHRGELYDASTAISSANVS